MSTVYTVNSSLLFLMLSLTELKFLENIQQISTTGKSLKTVWDDQSMTSKPDIAQYRWNSFKLTFTKPVDLGPFIKNYPSSIVKIYTVQSSLVFLLLILEEMPSLSMIEQISNTDESLNTVWTKSMGLEVNIDNYQWGGFRLIFTGSEDLTSIFTNYPTSIIEGLSQPLVHIRHKVIPRGVTRGVTRGLPTAVPKVIPAATIEKISITKDYLKEDWNAFNPSNKYSGIGVIQENKDGSWSIEYIVDKPPGREAIIEKATGPTKESAIKGAEDSIDKYVEQQAKKAT